MKDTKYPIDNFKKFNVNDYSFFVLGGDVGGTNTNLAVAGVKGDNVEVLFSMKFKTQELSGLNEAVKRILDYSKDKHKIRINNCCMAVAGPVSNGIGELTNVKWDVKVRELSRLVKKVRLINDLQAVGYGINMLKKKDIIELQKGKKTNGVKAIIAAGTGLGKGIIVDGEPIPSEGGYSDLPVKNELEMSLLQKLKFKEYEEVLSGRGIELIHEFLTKEKKTAAEAIMNKKTREMFKIFYARCAKNFALDVLATGGVYIAGGIAAKNPDLFDKKFLQEFSSSRFSQLLKGIPVYVITNYDVSLYGACYAARWMK